MTTAEERARQVAEGDLSSRLLERLVSQVGGHARVEAVFGDPVEREGFTVIPVARVPLAWAVAAGRARRPAG